MNIETGIQNEILRTLNHSGMAKMQRNVAGRFQQNGRWVTAGIPGSPDLLGYTFETITIHHVGLTLPIFTGIEVKTETGRLKKHQRAYLLEMERDNCIAGVARSPEQAMRLIQTPPRRRDGNS